MTRHEIATSRFLILGAARSGIGAAKLLKRHGADVVLADQKDAPPPELAAELQAAGISAAWGDACAGALEGRTILVKSPGIPQTNPVVVEARRRGIRVISEIELASAFADPQARVIAITGTNGKTTTTAWTAHLLQEAGLNAVLGGNIGDAWSNSVDAPENRGSRTVFVIEVSSFQLEDIEEFHPHVALLTNISPDHLDRYPSMEGYVSAKRNILRNMKPEDAFVQNADDPASENFTQGAPVTIYRFSAQSGAAGEIERGIRAEDGVIFLLEKNGERSRLVPVADLPLPGRHNLENAMAAALCAHLAGAGVEGIRQGLRTFRGVEHRIELCGEREGVRYYNDSKATNLDSTQKALAAFSSPIILIAGGRDAHSDYPSVNGLVAERVKRLITIGEAAPLLEETWGGLVPSERASGMEDAVRRAAAAASPGDVVLLSPACKSFDMYNNYEERGRDFKECVARLHQQV